MPLNSITIILFGYLMLLDVVSGTAIDVMHIDKKACSFDIYHLNEYDLMQLEWDGRQLPSYCKMSFIGRSLTESLNSYDVCVEALTYDINKCDFMLTYYSNNRQMGSYSCKDDLPPKICAGEEKYLDISFRAETSSTSSVTLLVTATLRKEVNMVMVYVAISMGVLVGTAGVFVVLCLLCRRRNRQSNQGMVIQRTTPITGTSTIIPAVPLSQPYIQTGPAQQAPLMLQHTIPVSPPMYSESLSDKTTLPQSQLKI
ncbi:uncharacterized protein LOC132558626 isoform X2 [Ylistrum balloti]|uniref:uncharacterized protein LOC132558626 isoform X2 n=1 Tax=Ylistrum balloti TaxID=509963 RepID=UPI00290583EE|nr:uncharacterized protein LOC132558626 isoform X2 [Ylistrum balloti]